MRTFFFFPPLHLYTHVCECTSAYLSIILDRHGVMRTLFAQKLKLTSSLGTVEIEREYHENQIIPFIIFVHFVLLFRVALFTHTHTHTHLRTYFVFEQLQFISERRRNLLVVVVASIIIRVMCEFQQVIVTCVSGNHNFCTPFFVISFPRTYFGAKVIH